VFGVLVADVAETCQRVQAAGGSVRLAPQVTPGGITFAHLLDPAGHQFEVFTMPPDRPASAHTGTPDCCSALMSRSIVRALTSNRPASHRALRGRGATARSSSTRAYSRSVRFTPTTIKVGYDIPSRSKSAR
jgi:hypothetical protein